MRRERLGFFFTLKGPSLTFYCHVILSDVTGDGALIMEMNETVSGSEQVVYTDAQAGRGEDSPVERGQ